MPKKLRQETQAEQSARFKRDAKKLIADGELETFLDGSARKITVESIRNLIARRLEAAKNDVEQLTPQARRRGRRPGQTSKAKSTAGRHAAPTGGV